MNTLFKLFFAVTSTVVVLKH